MSQRPEEPILSSGTAPRKQIDLSRLFRKNVDAVPSTSVSSGATETIVSSGLQQPPTTGIIPTPRIGLRGLTARAPLPTPSIQRPIMVETTTPPPIPFPAPQQAPVAVERPATQRTSRFLKPTATAPTEALEVRPIAIQTIEDFQPGSATTVGFKKAPNVRLEEAMEQLPEGVIQGTLIQVFNKEELKRLSGIRITSAETEMIPYSLNDPRMGCVNDSMCGSCNRYGLDCAGHIGYIELNRPFYHPQYIPDIIAVLTSVCNSCGELLLDANFLKDKGLLKYSGRTRLMEIAKVSGAHRKCEKRHNRNDQLIASCGTNPVYDTTKSKEDGKIMYRLEKSKSDLSGKTTVLPKKIEDVIKILNHISQKDAETLGFRGGSHPRDFILEVITVLPPRARPDIEINGTVQYNPITTLYKEIITENNKLLNKADPKYEDYSENLRKKIFKLINGADVSSEGTREFKGIKQFIQSKEGLVRQHIQAKRVNFSSRSVVTPDPTVKFGQFSMPAYMATKLTVPERVAAFNLSNLQRLMNEGKIKYIIPTENVPELNITKGYQFTVIPERHIGRYQLRIGDVIHRHLKDGDYAFFGRQPTCLV